MSEMQAEIENIVSHDFRSKEQYSLHIYDTEYCNGKGWQNDWSEHRALLVSVSQFTPQIGHL